MDFDLQSGMHELGDGPAAAGIELALDGVLTRVHRRRTAHATAYGVMGAAVVAVLALGGSSLDLDRSDDVLPATPATTRTPTAEPTMPAEPTPTPDPVPAAPLTDVSACGVPADPDGTGVTASATTSEVGGDVTTVLEVGGAALGGEGTISGVTLLALRAGVVVGVPASDVLVRGDMTLTAGPGVLSASAPLVACPPTGATATPEELGLGEYDLAARLTLTRSDGTTTVVTSRSVPLSVVAAGAEPDPHDTGVPPAGSVPDAGSGTGSPSSMAAEVPTYGLPACGQPWPGRAVQGGVVALDATLAVRGGTLSGQVTSTSTRVDITDGAALDPTLVVLRDGVVVARTPADPVVPFALREWRVGDTVTRSVSTPAVACTTVDGRPVGAELPAGTYEVWAVQGVWRSVDRSSGQNVQNGGPWYVTVG